MNPAHHFRSPDDLMRAAGVKNEALLCIARAAYGRPPLNRQQRRLFESLSKNKWPTEKVTLLILCLGRRALKTTLAAWILAYECLCGGHGAYAAEGSRIYAVVVCPAQSQAREAVRAIVAVLTQLRAIGVEYELRDLANVPEIVITNPRQRCELAISILTADPHTSRGRAVFCLVLDECAFLPHDSRLAFSDRDVVVAISSGMVQFPASITVMASTPGAPAGVFHASVTKQPKGSLLVRGPSWVTNPSITRAACEALAPDPHVFAQEFEARVFGFSGEHFLGDADPGGCVDVELCGRGPVRDGTYVCAVDIGQVVDDTAIAVASSHYASDQIDAKHVVLEHVERLRASKANPISIDAIAMRVEAISRRFNRAHVVADQFCRVELEQALKKRGVRFTPQPMHPAAQTPRWQLVKDLVRSKRLHLPDDGDLLNQLRQLKAVQLSSGALRVEGKKDDMADVVALACEQAITLETTGGSLRFERTPVLWDGHQLGGGERVYFRVTPNGERIPAEMPPGSPGWDEYCASMAARGISTPAIERWREQQQGNAPEKRLGINVSINNS